MSTTATSTPTVAELYEQSQTLREFIAWWIVDRRCPYPMKDVLIDLGASEDAQAGALKEP